MEVRKEPDEYTPFVKVRGRSSRLRYMLGDAMQTVLPLCIVLVLLLFGQLLEFGVLRLAPGPTVQPKPKGGVGSTGVHVVSEQPQPAHEPAPSALMTSRCQARAQWLERSAASSEEVALHNLPWPASCHRATNVCFQNGELVALGPGDKRGGDHFFDAPDAGRLKWFADQKVEFNLPGYFDGDEGVQKVLTPLQVRPVAGTLEADDFADAPLLNITPVIVFPIWPFNFAETLYPNFFYPWADFLLKQPAAQHLPVAVALPHSLRLPAFWKLLEPLVPAVESFGTLSAECGTRGFSPTRAESCGLAGCKDQAELAAAAAGPLCFKQVVGCSGFHLGNDRPMERSLNTPASAARNWLLFRSQMVQHHCGSLRARGDELVVGILQRKHNRRLLNVNDILARCSAVGRVAGRKVVCKELDFDNAHMEPEVCAVQEVDVLVGTNSGQLATSMFMHPGSSMIEVRAHEWYHPTPEGDLADPMHWSNAFLQTLWLTNATQYWWYGASKADSVRGPHSTYARDDDVTLRWDLLECMLQKIIEVNGDRDTYQSQSHYSSVALCEGGRRGSIVAGW